MIEHINRLERIANILKADSERNNRPQVKMRAEEILALVNSIRRRLGQEVADRTKEKGLRNQQS